MNNITYVNSIYIEYQQNILLPIIILNLKIRYYNK